MADRSLARYALASAAAVPLLMAPSVARAAGPGADESPDVYEVNARSETYVQLFQRALLPGPNGAIVTSDTVAPIYEYVSLDARDIDLPWQRNSLDVELSAWGNANIGDVRDQNSVDGDLQTANVRYRQGPAWVRIGRQNFAGGAANFSRFDGLSMGGQLPVGLGAEAYGGFTVLPRWNTHYALLGSAADTLLRDPDALPNASRAGYWLTGGRVFFQKPWITAGVSLHEEHASDELARRTVGADLSLDPFPLAHLGADALLDLDSGGLADSRVWIDSHPVRPLYLSTEFLHTEPALFLSRESVLSVFSIDTYDEVGTTLGVSPIDEIRLESSGYLELYSDGDHGARGEIALRLSPDRSQHTIMRLAYTRVRAVDNGYNALRDSLRQQLTRTLSATAEAYVYFYDAAIHGYTTSSVYAGTLDWTARPALDLLWGTSVAHSPYARADLQTMVRVVYTYEKERAE
jgi:hypothetical protein